MSISSEFVVYLFEMLAYSGRWSFLGQILRGRELGNGLT